MIKKNKINIRNALKTDENFLFFLEQEALSGKFQAIKNKAEQGQHPDIEMLYDFVLGWLDKKDAAKVREHIAVCRICAAEVLQIKMFEEEPEYTDRSIRKDLQRRIKEKSLKIFKKNPWQIFLASGLGTAAACIILVFLWPQTSDMEKMMIQAYNSDFIQKTGHFDKKYMLPWEKPVPAYGFTAQQRQSHAFRAFGAGLWSGWERFARKNKTMPDFLSPGWNKNKIKTDKWVQTSWSVYFHMGQWCFLMRTICSYDENVPVFFWEKNLTILEHIQKNYSARSEKGPEDSKIVKKTLQIVQSALINLKKSYKNKKYKKKVVSELDHFITYLSPGHGD